MSANLVNFAGGRETSLLYAKSFPPIISLKSVRKRYERDNTASVLKCTEYNISAIFCNWYRDLMSNNIL